MTSDSFVPGGYCAVDKDSARARAGEFAVVKEVVQVAQVDQATMLIFPSDKEAEARVCARGYAVTAASGASAAPVGPSPSELSAAEATARSTLTGVTKASMQNGSFGSTYKNLFVALDAQPAPAPDGIDLDGKTLAVKSLPVVIDGAVVGVFSGDVAVSAPLDDKVVLTFEHPTRGQCVATYHHRLVRDSVVLPETPLTSVTAKAGLARDLVKALDRSSRIVDSGAVDLQDVVETATAAGIDHSIVVGMAGADAVAPMLVQQLEAMLAHPGARQRTWPTLDAKRLGKTIADFDKNSSGGNGGSNGNGNGDAPPPPQFPRVEALKGKMASPGTDWKDLLDASISLSCADSASHAAFAKTDAHVATGALEHMLKHSGTKDAGSVAVIGKLENGLSLSDAKMFLFGIAAYSTSPPPGNPPPPPNGWNLNFTTPDLSGDEEDRRLRAATKADARHVYGEKTESAQLDKLVALSASGSALIEAIEEGGTSEQLRRLVTTDTDVEKACTGARHAACPWAAAPAHALRAACTRACTRGEAGGGARAPSLLLSPLPRGMPTVGARPSGHSLGGSPPHTATPLYEARAARGGVRRAQ